MLSVQQVDQRIAEHVVHFFERELPGADGFARGDGRDCP